MRKFMKKSERKSEKKNLLLINLGLLCVRPKSLPRTEKNGIPLSWHRKLFSLPKNSFLYDEIFMAYGPALLWFCISPERKEKTKRERSVCVCALSRAQHKANKLVRWLPYGNPWVFIGSLPYRTIFYRFNWKRKGEMLGICYENQINALFNAFYRNIVAYISGITYVNGNAFIYTHTRYQQKSELW